MPFEHGEDLDHLRSGTVDDSVFPHHQFTKAASRHFRKPASAIRMTSKSIGACYEPVDELYGRAW